MCGNELLAHNSKNCCYQKGKSAGEYIEKGNSSTLGKNVNRYSHCEIQYGEAGKNED